MHCITLKLSLESYANVTSVNSKQRMTFEQTFGSHLVHLFHQYAVVDSDGRVICWGASKRGLLYQSANFTMLYCTQVLLLITYYRT